MPSPTRNLLLASSALPLLWVSGCHERAISVNDLASSRLQQVILPSYQRLADSGQQLARSSAAYCREEIAIDRAQSDWRQAMADWLNAEPIAFGPITEDNRTWTLEFWPDKKNLVPKKVEGLLRPSALNAERVQQSSVLVQGFSALEYLLFDPQAQPKPSTDRCQGLVLISQGLADNLRGINNNWQGDQRQSQWRALTQPTSNTSGQAGHALEEVLLHGLVNSLDRAHKKLVLPLGKQHPRPYLGQSWRSRQGLVQIRASIEGTEHLWRGGEHTLADWSRAQQAEPTADAINQQFDRITLQLNALDDSLFETLGDPTQRPALVELANEIKRLEQLFSQSLLPALGVMPRFNANDGD